MQEIIKATEIITISDTHSDASGLTKMQKMLTNSKDGIHFVFNGDFIDRGNNSYKAFITLKAMARCKNFHVIIGNHDEFIYRALGIMVLTDDMEWIDNMCLWITNGGVKTIEQLVTKDRYNAKSYAELSAKLMKLYTIHMPMDERNAPKMAKKYRQLLREILSFYDGDLVSELRELYKFSTYKRTFDMNGKIIGFCHSGDPDNAFASPARLLNDYIKMCDAVVIGHWGIHHNMGVTYSSRYVQLKGYGFFKQLNAYNNIVIMIDSGCQTLKGTPDKRPKRNIVILNEKVINNIMNYEHTIENNTLMKNGSYKMVVDYVNV